MKNLLDYSLGCFSNKWAMQDVMKNAESIIDSESNPDLRREMLKVFRDFRIANQRFGMLLLKQDERMFGPKVSKQ
jgi:hypothetical protein